MTTQEQIDSFLAGYPEPKRQELETLHSRILQLLPGCKLWYSDGKNEAGKVVSNPTIGYGAYTIKYADGTTREFFQIGLSPNSTGISVYIMGLEDNTYLPRTYAATIGKATITGYCIKFKSLKQINLEVLDEAIGIIGSGIIESGKQSGSGSLLK